MTFYVISEPGFSTGIWHYNIMDGLIELQRKKRLDFEFLTDTAALNRAAITESDTAFVIGTDNEWLGAVLPRLGRLFGNKVIVLGNHNPILCGIKYSTVMTDVRESVTALYSYLKSHKKDNIALYGINPCSASDKLRRECFIDCGGKTSNLFYMRNSFAECFETFLRESERYDAIICVNDYAAISLIRHLGESNAKNKFFIAACGSSRLSQHFSPSLTHTESDYKKFAAAAYDIHRILHKSDDSNSVDIRLSCILNIGETTRFLPPQTEIYDCPTADKQRDLYYSDVEVREMMSTEKLLALCDDADRRIIELILGGKSAARIAEILYLSQSAVKYKIKKMYKICDVESKDDFVSILNKYIKKP